MWLVDSWGSCVFFWRRREPQRCTAVYSAAESEGEKRQEVTNMAKSKSSPKPKNKALYWRVKAEAKKKDKGWPSAYASGWLTKEDKKRGGTYE